MAQSPTRVIAAHVPIEMAEKIDELTANYDLSRGWWEEAYACFREALLRAVFY
ncbi:MULTISPECIES: hypothetical protein [unclassified Serratia (in: enterobacteria)]|uniref:hypothetical protein n=1 Tax=unclassified Serratia (in: enterobacteria) TaxID=2647522 RepID=UPI003075FEB9